MDLLPNIKCDLTPLVQWVPNGVNKILGLYFGPKIARQKAVECLIAAQTERNVLLIREGSLILTDENQLVDFDKIEKDNVSQCIEFAVVEAAQRVDEPSDEDISQTFFYKWREYAKSIDEIGMKQLWGKLLTNEIYEPNSVSLRLLHTLSMLSRKEIDVFLETLPYIIGEGYVVVDFIPINKQREIFPVLFSMGVITEIPKSGIKSPARLPRFVQGNWNYFYIYQRDKLIAFHDEENQENLLLEFISLTNVGRELYKLTPAEESEYITLYDSISKQSLNHKTINRISVYKIENNSVTNTLLEKNL